MNDIFLMRMKCIHEFNLGILLFLLVQVLHVQSMSEWAPMSIGPYSQATVIAQSIVFAAGTSRMG